MPRLSFLLSLSCCLGPLLCRAPAQDEVLAVERREDERGREVARRLLEGVRADFRCEAAAPRELCRMFATICGDKLSFCVANKDLGPVTATLDLARASLWSAMAVVQMQTGLRFVYRSGVVFLVPKDAIKPLTYVRVYDLRSQFVKLRSFPGPELRLPDGGDDRPLFPEAEESEHTVSGFSAEAVEALIRENVTPELWADGAASVAGSNGLFVARLTPQGHRQLRDLLISLGLVAPPIVIVREAAPPKRPLRLPGPAVPAPRAPRR